MAKFNVNFSDSTHSVLVELSERLDVPMADVIREALSLLWWFARELMAGNRILIQRGDQVTELVIPSLEGLRGLASPIRNKWEHEGESQRLPEAGTITPGLGGKGRTARSRSITGALASDPDSR